MCELTLSEAGLIETDYLVVSIIKPDYKIRSLADIPTFVAIQFPSAPRLKVTLKDPSRRIPMGDIQRSESTEVFNAIQGKLNDPRPDTEGTRAEQVYTFHQSMCKVYRHLNRTSLATGTLGAVKMNQYATMELSATLKVWMKRQRGILELHLDDSSMGGVWECGEEFGMFTMALVDDKLSGRRTKRQGNDVLVEELAEEFAKRWPMMPPVKFKFMANHEMRGLRTHIEEIRKREYLDS